MFLLEINGARMKLSTCCNDFFDRQIEYLDGEKRLDRLCLKNAVRRFLSSGSKDDAFDVYFCFCEIFKVFGEGYQGNTVKLLNTLADYELKASTLSEKHRDHYSHSVYVFSIGISVYQINENFNENFIKACLLKNMSADEEFLYRWGLSALFHDIGYPFEIAFNNIKEYTKNTFGESEPLLTYTKIEEFIDISSIERDFLSDSLGMEVEYVRNMHTLLAYRISSMLDIEYSTVFCELHNQMRKSVNYMDHAYFSTLIMLKNFFAKEKKEKAEYPIYLDTCINILLHSGFYRHNIGEKRKMSMTNPLAFLLMLCDDLQCFDRIGYGKKSKSEPLPRNCYIEQSKNKLFVTYAFNDNAITYKGDNGKLDDGEYIVGMQKKIQTGINNLYDLKEFGEIEILVEISNSSKPGVFHRSASFFQNILTIAKAVHRNYLDSTTYNRLDEEWDKIPLEYKMSNVLQAKSYAEKLNRLGFFYDDHELLLEKVTMLTEEQIDELARFEHERWINEKKQMGWEHAEYDSNDDALRKKMREEKRKHNCLIEYSLLDSNDQEKDKETVRFMIPNLYEVGFSVYKANKVMVEEKIIHIGIKGDMNLSEIDMNKVKQKVKERLKILSSNTKNKTIIICACAKGFDLLVAEVAMEMELYIKVILPKEKAEYLKEAVPDDESRRIYGKVESYKNKEIFQIPMLEETIYKGLSRYIAANSNTVIAGLNSNNAVDEDGGTKYTISLAKKFGRHLEIINLSEMSS